MLLNAYMARKKDWGVPPEDEAGYKRAVRPRVLSAVYVYMGGRVGGWLSQPPTLLTDLPTDQQRITTPKETQAHATNHPCD